MVDSKLKKYWTS